MLIPLDPSITISTDINPTIVAALARHDLTANWTDGIPLKKVPAIYFLFHYDALVYIGQAQDLTTRVENYRRRGRHEFNRMAVVDMTGIEDSVRKKLERALIEDLSPMNNNHNNRLLRQARWQASDALTESRSPRRKSFILNRTQQNPLTKLKS